MKIKSFKSLSVFAAIVASCTVPVTGGAQSITFTEWAIPGPSGSSPAAVQQQWFANLEQFISTGQPVGIPGTATYVAPITGPITSIPANEPELDFAVEITSPNIPLLASQINFGITDPYATFIGSFGYTGNSFRGSGIGWTTDVNGNKTFVTDPTVPVNGLLLEGIGFNMNMAPASSSATDPFDVTTLYSLNDSGYGTITTVSFELSNTPNPVPEPATFALMAPGLLAFIGRKREKLIRITFF